MMKLSDLFEDRKSGLSDKTLNAVKAKGEEILNTKKRGRKSASDIAKHEKVSRQLTKVGEVLRSRHEARLDALENAHHEAKVETAKHFNTVAHEALEHHGFTKVGNHHPISGQTYIKHDPESGLTHMIKMKKVEPKKGDFESRAGSLTMVNSSGMSRSAYHAHAPFKHNPGDLESHKNKITQHVADYVAKHKDDEEEENV